MGDSRTANLGFPHTFIEAGALVDSSASLSPGVVILQGSDERPTVVAPRVVVGANATVLGGVRLGEGCIVEPGSVVRVDVPPRVVVSGNPASIVGYAQTPLAEPLAPSAGAQSYRPGFGEELLSNGSKTVELPQVADLRGSLSVGEVGEHVPFCPNRYFLVFGVPSAEVRGEHAHHTCHQFLVCVAGRCHAVVEDGQGRREVALDRKNLGLYMPPMTWGVQYRYSSDAVLMVLASHPYDPADYIRDYGEFRALVAAHKQE